MFDDRRHTIGLAVAMILLVASVIVSYVLVVFAENCAVDLGFGDIMTAVKFVFSKGDCKG